MIFHIVCNGKFLARDNVSWVDTERLAAAYRNYGYAQHVLKQLNHVGAWIQQRMAKP